MQGLTCGQPSDPLQRQRLMPVLEEKTRKKIEHPFKRDEFFILSVLHSVTKKSNAFLSMGKGRDLQQ